MNKKFLSAILFGALAVTSTGSFVSCKDYDDDIDNLQTQINGLASAKDLSDKVSTLQSAISSAQTAAEAKAAAAQVVADAAKAAADKAGADAADVKKALDAAVADLEAKGATKEELEAAKAVAAEAAAAAQKAGEDAAAAVKEVEAKLDAAVEAADAKVAEAAAAAAAAQKAVDELAAGAASQADLAAVKAAAAAAQAAADAAQATADEAKAAAAENKAALAEAATKAELDAVVAKVAANTAALKAKADAETVEALEARVKALETAVEALAGGEEAYKALVTMAEKLENDLNTLGADAKVMVTSVDLYYNYDNQGANFASDYKAPNLTFVKAIEKETKFGPKDEITFVKDKVNTYTQTIKVRVSPADAELKPEMIQLINSQGKSLSEFVTAKSVKRSTNLLTRAAGQSGLWDVEFQLVEENYTDAKFMAATRVDSNNDKKLTAADKQICFAVAVNNTDSEDRLVVSAYDVTTAYDNYVPSKTLDFYVNETPVKDIHNRYELCEDGTSTINVAELGYNLSHANGYDVPAIKEAFVSPKADQTDNKYNVINIKKAPATATWDADNRQDLPFYVAGVNSDITIKVNYTKTSNGNLVLASGKEIRGLYVTLDKAHALESDPSEINAWNSYEYTNVGTDKVDATVVEGNEITIKVNSKEADGDVIGFRVYAVNLDGTLMDPDGRAFYVAVGNYSEAASVIKAQVIANTLMNPTSDFIEVDASYFPAVLGNVALTNGKFTTSDNVSAVTLDSSNPKYGDPATASPVVVATFYKDKNNGGTLATKMSEAKYVKITLPNASQYIDGATYKQSYTLSRVLSNGTSAAVNTKVPVKTISIETTKVMPTAFPEDFAFRPMQEEQPGVHRAYMVPGDVTFAIDPTVYALGDAPATTGFKDLNNVFYGLKKDGTYDDNYVFKFATTVYNGNTKDFTDTKVVELDQYYDASIAGDPTIGDGYVLEVPTKLIDKTSHDVKIDYMYREVSTYYDAAHYVWKTGVDYAVAYDKQITFIYDCWANASKFSWNAPTLQWTTEGVVDQPYAIANILTTNSYDNTFYGKNLDVLVNTNKWLKIKDNKAELTYGDQVNPYFTVKVEQAEVIVKPAVMGKKQATDDEGNPIFEADGKTPHMVDVELEPAVKENKISFVYNQQSTQSDAAPTADHIETIKFVLIDVYGHEIPVALNVNVKAPVKK